jgi:hypothetical protein
VKHYSFVTRWLIDAPIDRVWNAIADPSSWPIWWRSVRRVVNLQIGEPDGTGAVRRFTWQGRLPYTLTFDMKITRIEKSRLIEGNAEGELKGKGLWTFEDLDGRTAVQYDWNVYTTKWWMNLLSPLFSAAFHWNHDFVMRQGGEGLSRYLSLDFRNEAVNQVRKSS